MSFLLEHNNWIWVVAAALSGGLLLWPRLGSSRSGVSTAEAVRLINREKAVVIDVCEPAEYAAGHVAGARHVPLADIATSKNLPSNKALPLVVLCATGSRASRAAAALQKRGHEQVHVLAGGLAAWREAQLPVEKSA
ncbi:MAG: rhodanese-like domain-containing protein [Burkholderiales bacterium]